ncbi:zinc-dependent metalloprotease [Gabonibacter chumensis]|uniref:zinc-dependent metalloprotease n=1 Tax=Gabonibacter chumensis TaxID=2972474 RepID=UPI00257465E9|nr:zinc-dependent metalloprotease [Gabonibacter chumensis]MCR9011538.1 zinc-dependent metalloprotease [Gabonibacter chumensis]
MKKWFVLFVAVLLIFPFANEGYGASRKRKKKKEKEKTEQVAPKKKETPYEKLMKKPGRKTAESNFLTLHKIEGKLYVELPVKYMERDMLLASAASATSNDMFCKVGYKEKPPMHIKFSLEDSTVFMKRINVSTRFNTSELREELMKDRNFMDPTINTYKIEAYNNDSSAVVLNMTALFTGAEMSPVSKGSIVVSIIATPKTGTTRLGEIKAFDDNVVIKTSYSYSVSINMLGLITLLSNEPLTVNTTRSLLLLPEDKMRPRISDARVGIFLTEKRLLSDREDGMQAISFANRWRLEPSDVAAFERGELVEPVKPIVWYVDDAFPETWRQPIKDGVLRWNKAFEKIGFKNVMQVRDFPKNDPEFDPDNLKYSCIRYIPTSTPNAMGPSWVDPTTGEIINASVIIYNDLIRLINEWRFTQTAQIDPRVRSPKMPDDVINESLAYAVAHEIGHTLGFMHNMAASSAYPVDSLRSVSFTRKYGTTPSIMDYARYNYVAQPTDKGVSLSPPDLGVYDEYAVKWLYSYFPKAQNSGEEAKILESWVDEKAGDPIYRYGKQQIHARFDPTAIEEDLGNDAIKAGDYGIKNLKYILSHLNQWITNDPDVAQRTKLYNSIANQYVRYLHNVMYNVGGIYLTEVKDGTPGKRFESVPKKTQRAALKWIINQIKTCGWLDNKAITDKVGLGVAISRQIQNIGAEMLWNFRGNVLLSAHVSKDPYTIREYFDDLYNGIWESAIKGRKVTSGDKVMQKTIITSLASALADKNKKTLNIGFTSDEAFLPSLEEIYLYGLDASGFTNRYIDELRPIEARQGHGAIAKELMINKFAPGYRWQRKIDLKTIEETNTTLWATALKIEKLLKQAINTAPNRDSKEHYQAMLIELKRLTQEIKI